LRKEDCLSTSRFKPTICFELGEVLMTAAPAIVAIAAALVCGAAVWATPAGAAIIEFSLGSEPEVALSFFQLGIGPPFFAVTARLDASTALWVRDVAIGQVFSAAEVTETFAQSGRTFDFSGVTAATVFEDTFGDAPTITATFDYKAFSEHVSAVPEPSIWAMLLLGSGGLAFGGHCASRRRRFERPLALRAQGDDQFRSRSPAEAGSIS
jgi:PEP-CTERM motif